MQEYTQLISQVGFPIFTAVYLMLTVTKALKEVTSAVNELKTMIEINNKNKVG